MVLHIALALVALRLAAELFLSLLNSREVRRRAAAPPASSAAIMDAATSEKAAAYTLAKGRLGRVELAWDAAVLAALLLSGALPRVYDAICPPFVATAAATGTAGAAATATAAAAGTAGAAAAATAAAASTGAAAATADAGAWFLWSRVFFLLGAGIALSLLSLPLDWWGQFRVEQRFGFNKSTPGLWVADKLKGLALSIVIGAPVLWVLLRLARLAGGAWWAWGFVFVFGFQLLMLVLYPKLILPLFNKLTPLPDGGLRARLLALAERSGFRASAIQVMDGSKRSGHANAFFTGFGRFRRIVLFDTLVGQLAPGELEAVLAHEIGHCKRGHIPKMLALSAALLLGGFALIAWLAGSAWFNPAFGFPEGDLAPAFLLFALLGGTVTFWLTPLGNRISRKHEYEADAFARGVTGGPAPLVAALRKLAQKNLSNLTPHPWFSGFYYSHPTLAEREAALNAAQRRM
ncbi:MAG: M48 family metallopeptidase [Opitutaceae bacterium]|jgi:STE24 endopeptidase|nr:M48 family metallopeptidase [Opitutaceae bacterium]